MSWILPEYFWEQSDLLSLWSALFLTQSNARQVMRDNAEAMLYVNRQGETGSFSPWQEPVYLQSHVMLTATQLPGLMNSVEHQLWRYFFLFFPLHLCMFTEKIQYLLQGASAICTLPFSKSLEISDLWVTVISGFLIFVHYCTPAL